MHGNLLFFIVQNALDLIRVDNRVNIRIGDDLSLKSVVPLFSRSILCSELLGQLGHG